MAAMRAVQGPALIGTALASLRVRGILKAAASPKRPALGLLAHPPSRGCLSPPETVRKISRTPGHGNIFFVPSKGNAGATRLFERGNGNGFGGEMVTESGFGEQSSPQGTVLLTTRGGRGRMGES